MAIRYFAGILVTLLIVSIASASMLVPVNDNAKDNSKAPENSQVIGENWDLERVDFIHYAKQSSPARPSKQTTCYKLMGVKWNNLPVDYVINPTNTQSLDENFVLDTIALSAETWDNEISRELFNNGYTVDPNAIYGDQNFKNAIVFGDYGDSNAIAVTSVWFVRTTKQIVEFDIIFNTRFNWGNADIDPSLMDLQNIATHEFGHSFGLDDIYLSSCSSVTMYGYSYEGDTSKRILENPDILGLRKLYGI